MSKQKPSITEKLKATSGFFDWSPFIDMHVHLPADDPEQYALFEKTIERMTIAGLRKIIVVNTLHGEPNRWEPSMEQLLAGWERLRAWTRRDASRRFGMAFLAASAFAGKPVRDTARYFIDTGAVCFKITLCAKDDNSIYPEIFKFVEMAAEFNVPALIHCYLRPTPTMPGELTPDDVACIARRVPEAKIILAHAGADYQRALPGYADIPNICVDISGSRCYEGMVDTVVRWMGEDRVLFGSDFFIRGPWSQLAKLACANISPETRRKILYDNAERLFFGSR